MTGQNARDMGDYNLDRIFYYAKKRFIEGCNTIDLMEAAESDREREEIALVALLNVEDKHIRNLQLTCKYSEPCNAIDYRNKLRAILGEEFAFLGVN